MKYNNVYSYLYDFLSKKKYINELDYEDAAIKTQKVLYIAELTHRILFGEPLITDAKYVCLKNGPAIGNKYIEKKESKKKAHLELSEDEKHIIDACLKKWILEKTTEELVKITHKENKDIPLIAWKTIVGDNPEKPKVKYGSKDISETLIEKDASIFREATKYMYV